VIPLLPHEAHLWLAATDGEALSGLPAAWALLDAGERERADRFLVEHARTEYILSHGLVRTVLSAHTGVDPRDFAFAAGVHGKPWLEAPAEHRRLRFNLSHSRGLAACAVAIDRDVGVDVEQRSERVSIEDLTRTVFSASGVRAFAALAPARKRDFFFAKWTLKEALVKARGDGLSLDVKRIRVDLGEDLRVLLMTLDGVDVSPTWDVRPFRPTPDHAGALVVTRGAEALHVALHADAVTRTLQNTR
jgi:4'-phosphopantetheinyl transferase